MGGVQGDVPAAAPIAGNGSAAPGDAAMMPGTSPAFGEGQIGTGVEPPAAGSQSDPGMGAMMPDPAMPQQPPTGGDGDGDAMDPAGDGDGDATVDPPEELERFSFFVTSLEVMRELSGSPNGFGGDLGGLSGADSICQQAAERVGFGAKTWRAFLSAVDGGDGQPVHAKDRIGQGPWYDRNGRLIAQDLQGLLDERPAGDMQAVNDLPNEFGEGLMAMGDTHDVITATNTDGELDADGLPQTCNDWTSTSAMPGGGRNQPGGVRLGHSWPAGSGRSWSTAHTARSCAAGVNLVQDGGGDGSSIGAGGGWGAIYCFALQP